MSKVKLFWLVAFMTSLFCFMPASGIAPAAESQGDYAGVETCKGCHGKITQGWQKTSHAKAIESLKKTNQQNLPGCVRCHVTGYEEPSGFIDFDLTPELANVQCEACHGPRKDHAANPSKAGSPVTEDKCRKCHTPGQDSHFDYKQKVRFVHGN